MYKFALVKKELTDPATNKIMRPGDVYFLDNERATEVLRYPGEGIEIIELENLLKILDYNKDSKFTNVLMICPGGIGDIIARSSLCHYLSDKNILFATSYKNFPVLKWFESEPKAIDMRLVLINNYNTKSRLIKYNNWRTADTFYKVNKNNHEDWQKVLFDAIGITNIDEKYYGPKLKCYRICENVSNIKEKESIFINNRSSCMMRNIEFSDIYKCIPEIWFKHFKIYTYSDYLSQEDSNKTFNGINFIKSQNIEQYLLDIYDAAYVISVDSATLHFREGVHRPSIGLFSSFDKNIRTKYYRYTNSFNIKSECALQPCFTHYLKESTFCPAVKAWQFSPPCVRQENNKYLQEQLRDIFENYVKKI